MTDSSKTSKEINADSLRAYLKASLDDTNAFDVLMPYADEIERLEKRAKIAELKASGTLADNLCPDHRDKQTGRPCLACEIERLGHELASAKLLHLADKIDAEHLSPLEQKAMRLLSDERATVKRLRAALGQINDECISAGLIARMALNGEDPVAAARIARGAGETGANVE